MSGDLTELLAMAQQGDKAAREQLVVENAGLVWSIARRYFGRGVEPDDLYQLGCLGFLKAIDGFDLQYGTQFSTYGSVKERSAAIKQTRARLTAQWNREPTLSELAEVLDLTVEEIAAAETATAATESIQRESGEEGFTLEHILTDGAMEDQLIEKIALKEAVAKLPERDRTVIALRYYRGMTQDTIAKLLGVSQVQVSRIEKKALQTLRQYI